MPKVPVSWLGLVVVLSALGIALAGSLTAVLPSPVEAAVPRPVVQASDQPPFQPEILRAKPYDEPARIAAPAPRMGGPGARVAQFDVTDIGFDDKPDAKVAFQHAVGIWAGQLSSPVPIRVNANWSRLAPEILAEAGPAVFLREFQEAPQPGTWYPIATATRTATGTPTTTATAAATGSPSVTPSSGTSPTGTATPTRTPTASSTVTTTVVPGTTVSPTATAVPTFTPGSGTSPTGTPAQTATATPSATGQPVVSPTATQTVTPTHSPTQVGVPAHRAYVPLALRQTAIGW